MAVNKIYIDNFKGIDDAKWIDIKPITAFVGSNSSGKSSCIHALACLSQTLKVPNNSLPLLLDDEHTNVHLGRFIEVIRSQSFQGLMSLGLSIEKDVPFVGIDENGEPKNRKGPVEAIYDFKYSQRTQDIRIESAAIKVADISYSVKWPSARYSIMNKNTSKRITLELGPGFLFDPETMFRRRSKALLDFLTLINAQAALSEELNNTFYLGPFREASRIKYATRGANPVEVGPMGESTEKGPGSIN